MIAEKMQFSPLAQAIAERAMQDLHILYEYARADAVIHCAQEDWKANEQRANYYAKRSKKYPGAVNDLVTSVMEVSEDTFKGTPQHMLLKNAFNNLTWFFGWRNLENANPEERTNAMKECLDTAESDRQEIARHVEAGTLPKSCQKHFEAAYATVTTEHPRQSWVTAARARAANNELKP